MGTKLLFSLSCVGVEASLPDCRNAPSWLERYSMQRRTVPVSLSASRVEAWPLIVACLKLHQRLSWATLHFPLVDVVGYCVTYGAARAEALAAHLGQPLMAEVRDTEATRRQRVCPSCGYWHSAGKGLPLDTQIAGGWKRAAMLLVVRAARHACDQRNSRHTVVCRWFAGLALEQLACLLTNRDGKDPEPPNAGGRQSSFSRISLPFLSFFSMGLICDERRESFVDNANGDGFRNARY